MEFAWITESLKHGCLLPEERFEVNGEGGGPHRARMWKGTPLLQDFHVTVIGSSTKMAKEQLLQLLNKCGATVIDTGIAEECSTVIVDLCDPGTRDRKSFQGITKMCTVVTYNWVVDTISNYRVQPYEKYKVDSPQIDPEVDDRDPPKNIDPEPDFKNPGNQNEQDLIHDPTTNGDSIKTNVGRDDPSSNKVVSDGDEDGIDVEGEGEDGLSDCDTEDPFDLDYQPPEKQHKQDLNNGCTNGESRNTNVGRDDPSSYKIVSDGDEDGIDVEGEDGLSDCDTEDPFDLDYQPPEKQHKQDLINGSTNGESSKTNVGRDDPSSYKVVSDGDEDGIDVEGEDGHSDCDTDPNYQPLEKQNKQDLISRSTNGESSKTNVGRDDPSSYKVVSDGDEDGIDVEGEDEDDNSAETFVVESSLGKYSYCLYCSTRQLKLPRHCARKHGAEYLVSEALAADDKGDKWLHIRNLGNHDHNNLVFSGKAKDLVVRRRAI
ncbi:uncharacterized protein [Apostichopus japonicus]|uniref:uncharacterized protein n=1 Tax=Stichopus japonicus TaxID=307972 RepID=UPI003AB5E79F